MLSWNRRWLPVVVVFALGAAWLVGASACTAKTTETDPQSSGGPKNFTLKGRAQ